MPRTVSKALVFPLGGVVRRGNYRDQTRPYSAPWAVNMRGVDVLEGRDRGGSRPGLVEVEDVTTTSYGEWKWPEGSVIEFPGGGDKDITYAYSDIQYSVDGYTIINPTSLITAVAEQGYIPDNYTHSCIYRDRVVIAKDTVWYASRIGEHRDWDYGAEMTDVARAVAGTVELAGQKGNDITALIPYRDKALIIATCNSLHILEGDPATGNLRVIDENIGIIAPYAWAFNGDVLAFLSNDGVYIGAVGQKPQRFSEGRIPGELKNVQLEVNTFPRIVVMAYDASARGFHLSITPTDVGGGDGYHYFLDIDNRAIWPVVFGDGGHQPVVAATVKSENLERVIFRGRDATWREYSSSADDDDGEDIQSHILIGPIRISSNDIKDAMLAEIHGILATGSGNVTWALFTGDTAEEVVDTSVAALTNMLDLVATGTWKASGLWSAGRNYVVHPRSRGSWVVIWMHGLSKWAYESVSIVARQLGRER